MGRTIRSPHFIGNDSITKETVANDLIRGSSDRIRMEGMELCVHDVYRGFLRPALSHGTGHKTGTDTQSGYRGVAALVIHLGDMGSVPALGAGEELGGAGRLVSGAGDVQKIGRWLSLSGKEVIEDLPCIALEGFTAATPATKAEGIARIKHRPFFGRQQKILRIGESTRKKPWAAAVPVKQFGVKGPCGLNAGVFSLGNSGPSENVDQEAEELFLRDGKGGIHDPEVSDSANSRGR
jgi:hypothetical protein